MKRIFVPTKSGKDWQRLLGKPKLHWKKGYSAMASAACWEDSESELPKNIKKLLESIDDPDLLELELLLAIPEWKVSLPGGKTDSQSDVMAICRNKNNLVLLGIEAKVDEPFGPTIGEKKKGASKGQIERIEYIEKQLGRTTPFGNDIRYQLIHRTVSTLITARKFHAPTAVMLVHSFSQTSKWRDDFEAFCNELDCVSLSKDIKEVPKIEAPRLFLAWCNGDEKYLGVELPSIK